MKPTYEELELQLEESRREFRAAGATIHNLELKLTDMAVQLANAESKCRELAAENGQMLRLLTDISENHDEYVNADEYLYAGVPMDYVSEINAYVSRDVDAENPFKATDVFLAEVRASARNEGINYAASRLAAAFNHGFLDKPVSEVLDVTRMILSAKEDLANAPLPADDGLSGEYAEKAIEEWADQIRKGVQS
ncbi:hypothetical protein M0X61_20555 [Salmonella enterica]|uniref:hypothetical protein n=1 Tax=Salmonella enterica TaxID=28901 RepID=UPI0020C2CE1C|nr:hypothetical protein [Salmonella enterica]MCY4938037.1 hypothetical protein [Salmonella enterica subsp. enterica serovar 1,4,[5],12:i:-]MCY5048619.1 hypothetical protein [Salmonella enterica subsp. enterica serovar 1,4,[5],12:i:-]MCY5077925.1 hypothetical protein [Salmonella enterica subsp. enterica serovar 1,4,[5],12:i:-]MDJ1732464.1 hypothetical protein [Salmonella enterica]MDJ1742450.1 hypothetical protein [Salmonella enterica]